MTEQVRTRVAPSPTGYAHLGIVYQSLFDYVFAHKYQGKFVLRIEDTDRSRFVEGAEEIIVDSLKWVNLEPDEGIGTSGGEYGPYRQSEKLELYQKHAIELLKKGYAYYCFCTKERLDQMRKSQEASHEAPMYDRTCLKLSDVETQKKLSDNEEFVIRMKIPDNQKITVEDAIVGKIDIDSSQIDDQVIIKSDGFPTYHLAVVVDDYYMKITHIFRGTEWIPSTPKHVLLWEYLGWKDNMPKFAHLPLLLNNEGAGKLSKRQGHSSVLFYRQEGFLPEAVLNYLANVVWNHPEGKEIFPVTEFAKAFELEPFKVSVKPQGAKFDLQKLEWMNGEYIRKLSDEELAKRIHLYLKDLDKWAKDIPTEESLLKITPLIKERIKKLSDFIPLTLFLYENPEYDLVIFKKVKSENQKEILERIIETLNKLSTPWKKEEFEMVLQNLAKEAEIGNRDFFQLLRIAITGQLVSPPLFESMILLSEEESIKRIKGAIDFLTNPPAEPKY